MHFLKLCVCKATIDAPEVISDEARIMKIAGLAPTLGYAGVALQEDGPGIVLTKTGRYVELPHGYFVSYSEEPVPIDY